MLQLSTALLANMDISKLLRRHLGEHPRGHSARHRRRFALRRRRRRPCGAFSGLKAQAIFHAANCALSLDGYSAGLAFRTREPVADRAPGGRPDCLRDHRAPDQARHAVRLLGSAYPPRQGHWNAMLIASQTGSAFGQQEADMLMQIAAQVAMAVNNAIAFRQIAELARPAAPGKAVSRRRNQPRKPL